MQGRARVTHFRCDSCGRIRPMEERRVVLTAQTVGRRVGAEQDAHMQTRPAAAENTGALVYAQICAGCGGRGEG